MDGTELTLAPDVEPSASHDAIREIVQVFKDGYTAVKALRRTANGLSPSEVESQISAIELRMVSEISMICDGCLLQLSGAPRH